MTGSSDYDNNNSDLLIFCALVSELQLYMQLWFELLVLM